MRYTPHFVNAARVKSLIEQVLLGGAARTGVQSSLTGHLVFSTRHTNDAAGAVVRMLDLGIEPYLVASSIIAVLAQRLVRRICPQCRTEAALTEAQRLRLGLDKDAAPQRVSSYGTGCAHCLDTGYYERTGVYELLRIDERIRSLIADRARAGEIKRAALGTGLTTLRQDAIEKVRAGHTTVDEVVRVIAEN